MANSNRRVLIRNAGSPNAPAVARQYAAEGWDVCLEISEEDAPGNDLLVEIWDAGGEVRVLCADTCLDQDARLLANDRNAFDCVVDTIAPETTRAPGDLD
jgi:hypothetical protein